MRIMVLAAVLVLAACGQAEEQKAKAPDSLPAGQYEVAMEVTTFRAADKGAPKIDAPVGSRAARSVCVGQGQLPSELFVEEGYDCREGQAPFLSAGSMNLTLSCAREGLDGTIGVSVAGTFTSDSYAVDRRLVTTLRGEGDVNIVSRITGRRTGDCTPGAEAPAAGNSSNAAGDAP